MALLLTPSTHVNVGNFTKKNSNNHKAILFQGLALKSSVHALPAAEEPYLVVLGMTPDSASQAYFKVILMIDFSGFSVICAQLSFSLLTQLL